VSGIAGLRVTVTIVTASCVTPLAVAVDHLKDLNLLPTVPPILKVPGSAVILVDAFIVVALAVGASRDPKNAI
jgi:hypothetical protein